MRFGLCCLAVLCAALGSAPDAVATWRNVSLRWSLEHVIDGGWKLRIAYGWGCPYFPSRTVDVKETKTTVTLKVLGFYHFPTEVECDEVAHVGRLTVSLPQPLDGRKLRHAPVTPYAD
jgi:hypothetical protein